MRRVNSACTARAAPLSARNAILVLSSMLTVLDTSVCLALLERTLLMTRLTALSAVQELFNRIISVQSATFAPPRLGRMKRGKLRANFSQNVLMARL